jgi:hypothetical protein
MDFMNQAARWLSVESGRPLSDFPRPTEWFPEKEWGITKHDFNKAIERGVEAGFIFADGEPVPGAKLALRRLHRAGHTIHLVTARGYGRRAPELTAEWLYSHKIYYDSLSFSADKTIIANAGAALDDKPSNVDALRAEGCAAFLYDLGRKDQADHPFLVSGWSEFEKEVGALC